MSIVVTTTADPPGGTCQSGVSCSLRQAIAQANASGGDSVISFAVDGTFAVTDAAGGELHVSGSPTQNLAIQGDGANLTVLDAGGENHRVLEVDQGATVALSGATVQNGLVAPSTSCQSARGGGVLSSGDVTISDSDVHNNTVVEPGTLCGSGGGGIEALGNLTVLSSTIDHNSVSGGSGGSGGGIEALGNLTVLSSTIDHNLVSNGSDDLVGGGIAMYGAGSGQPVGTFTIRDSQLLDNALTAATNMSLGGGASVDGAAAFTVSGSTFAGNVAQGGRYAFGGGLGMGEVTSGAQLTNLTIDGNSASGGTFASGGGLVDGGRYSQVITTTLAMSTLSGNTVSPHASAGAGSSVGSMEGDVLRVQGTILAGDPSNNCGTSDGMAQPQGVITSIGDNLETGSSCGFAAPGDQGNTNPMLGPLVDNGGPTPTRALLPGSPAIDAVRAADCPPPTGDQRGVTRPQGAACDIGAYELALDANSTIVATPDQLPADGVTASTITVTLLDGQGVPVPGHGVRLDSVAGAPAPTITGPVVTDGSGHATFQVTASTNGTSTFRATDTTTGYALLHTAQVTFGPVSQTQSSVVAAPTSVVANGQTSSIITVTLKDQDGNPVSGKTVSLAQAAGPGTPTISTPSGPSDGGGVVTFTVKSTTPGSDTFAATDTTDSVTIDQTASVTFTMPTTQSVRSTRQYTLSNSNGSAWVEIDSTNLRISQAPNTSVSVLLSANSDLWTQDSGYNQDLGIFVSDSGGADQLLAWKESGGFAGTYSPNAAYVQTLFSEVSGHSYVFKLKWKTNKQASGVTIRAGAGPSAPFSPTTFTAETFPAGMATNFASSTGQYSLSNSDGSTWTPMDNVKLATTLTPAANSVAMLGGNADLWTMSSGVNQDIAIMVSVDGGAPQLVAWKESGGFAGTFSPNAAFVQATYAMSGGHSYAFSLAWKTNIDTTGSGKTIVAGAGPFATKFSPTDLFAATLPAAVAPAAVSPTQYALSNSDGLTWRTIDTALDVVVTPSWAGKAIVGANADLWTATTGYNQDLGIFVSVDGGNDALVAWKESGGFAGAFSPNAAFVQTVYNLVAGHSYRFRLKWKTNKNAPGVTIYAGAGNGSPFSPTSMTLQQTQ